MTHFEKFIQLLQGSYYADLIASIAELTAIIVGIRYAYKSKIARLFVFYMSFDLIILIIDWYMSVYNEKFPAHFYSKFVCYTNPLIGLVELLVYFYYFHQCLSSKLVKSWLNILAGIYLLLFILLVVTSFQYSNNRFQHNSYMLGTIELFFLLPPCYSYFSQIMNKKSEIELLDKPSFWITLGIFIFSVIAIPLFAAQFFFSTLSGPSIFSLTGLLFFSIPYALNFLFLTKAFLCKKPLTI